MTTLPSSPPPLPPTTASYILATSILAGCFGYFLGQASSLGLFSSSSSSTSKPNPSSRTRGSNSIASWPNSYDVTVHPDSSDEELMTHLKREKKKKKKKKKGNDYIKKLEGDSEESTSSEEEEEEEEEPSEEQDGLRTFAETKEEECKLVLVVRTDLGMSKGKTAAQCSHATLACYKHLLSHAPTSPLLRRWESTGQAKIAVQVPSEEQLEELRAKAVGVGLCARVIRDAGRTQVASGSATVLGVGPGPRSVVDGVTGGLRLL